MSSAKKSETFCISAFMKASYPFRARSSFGCAIAPPLSPDSMAHGFAALSLASLGAWHSTWCSPFHPGSTMGLVSPENVDETGDSLRVMRSAAEVLLVGRTPGRPERFRAQRTGGPSGPLPQPGPRRTVAPDGPAARPRSEWLRPRPGRGTPLGAPALTEPSPGSRQRPGDPGTALRTLGAGARPAGPRANPAGGTGSPRSRPQRAPGRSQERGSAGPGSGEGPSTECPGWTGGGPAAKAPEPEGRSRWWPGSARPWCEAEGPTGSGPPPAPTRP